MPRGAARAVAPLMLALLVGACSRVTILAGDGTVTTHDGFGLVRVEASPRTSPQIVSLSEIGVVAGGEGVTLGYRETALAILPVGDCRVVVWLDKTPTAEVMALLERRTAALCPVGPGAMAGAARGAVATME